MSCQEVNKFIDDGKVKSDSSLFPDFIKAVKVSMSRQTPKIPDKVYDKDLDRRVVLCPTCRSVIDKFYQPCCSQCGQRINWDHKVMKKDEAIEVLKKVLTRGDYDQSLAIESAILSLQYDLSKDCFEEGEDTYND